MFLTLKLALTQQLSATGTQCVGGVLYPSLRRAPAHRFGYCRRVSSKYGSMVSAKINQNKYTTAEKYSNHVF